jgi:nucleoside permease NupC
MLMAFLALLAMVNMFIGWAGGLFYDGPGLLRFNLLAVSALGVLVAVRRFGPPRDTAVWWALLPVLVVSAGAGSLLPAAASTIVIGMVVVAWISAFLAMGRTAALPSNLVPVLTGGVVAANLLFLAFGPLPGDTSLSLQMILGWLHWPVAFAMGTPIQDCLQVGRLLGEKLVLTEFVAYADLGAYLAAAGRGEVPALDPRSIVLASYALSGFSNFASIAIQIGGISPMAPSRRRDIASLGLKAMIGGALASYALASVAGVFYNGRSMLGG